jgi:hypothetical protein
MVAFVDREASLQEMLIVLDYLGNYVSQNKKLSGSPLPTKSGACSVVSSRRLSVHCGVG